MTVKTWRHGQGRHSHDSLDRKINSEGITIDNKIIDSEFFSVIMHGIKGDSDGLINCRKSPENIARVEKIHKWLSARKKEVYSIKDSNSQEHAILYSDYAIKAVKAKQKEGFARNQSKFNELVEFCILDYLKALFDGMKVSIVKTSEYDDIKHGIDYILAIYDENDQAEYIGLDLSLSHNEELIQKKESRGNRKPREFNIHLGKKTQIQGKKVYIKGAEEMPIKVLNFEPNMIQFFISEYTYFISTLESLGDLSNDDIINCWEIALEDYLEDDSIEPISGGIFNHWSKKQVIDVTLQTQDQILTLMNQNEQ